MVSQRVSNRIFIYKYSVANVLNSSLLVLQHIALQAYMLLMAGFFFLKNFEINFSFYVSMYMLPVMIAQNEDLQL